MSSFLLIAVAALNYVTENIAFQSHFLWT